MRHGKVSSNNVEDLMQPANFCAQPAKSYLVRDEREIDKFWTAKGPQMRGSASLVQIYDVLENLELYCRSSKNDVNGGQLYIVELENEAQTKDALGRNAMFFKLNK